MISNYKLSKPCKHCGCEYQFQSRASCVKCHKEKSKSYYQKNKEKCQSLVKVWASENKEYCKQYRRAYYEVNGK